ncbi:octopamine receptor Oamb isoform X2 [Chironomus tepperi]|uniref:octopamine receptor Oamb isoform X2 n=1 Tax=Chironomus tepperi TaxID=113505 RepID=UPI00391F93FF
MNETECDQLIESVQWTEPKNLISLAILGFIDILVIVGNCLVIAAVFCSHKLRSVTNFFIVSLAVSDLLVGLAVLPFSSTWEVFKVWIFGDIWCKIWLAVDVLLCTASILNLCAISLDRYVAVTRPVTYPSIMSTKRAKSLIAGLWVLSFVICFPPLVGWKNQSQIITDDLIYQRENYTLISATIIPSTFVKCQWKCELTNDAGYVVYSAFGSFYIPMLVMLFFYWRIYRAAVRTTRAINRGFRTTKGKCGKNNQVDEENVTLRIHRGNKKQGQNQNYEMTISNSITNLDSLRTNPVSVTSMPSYERKKRHSSRYKDKVTISISYPSTDHIASPTISTTSSNQTSMISSCSKEPISLRQSNASDCTDSQNLFRENINNCSPKNEFSPNSSGKKGKRTISGAKVQVRKFRMETKAAKTLAIIVGMFVLCWCPFFTLYLIRPFCDDCVNPILFSVLFWLGYCNSAVNPFIYAMFSKDFRFAFKRVIYRCFCSKKYLEEHKFHVLHRFVPIPFAAGIGQRNDLNFDIAR